MCDAPLDSLAGLEAFLQPCASLLHVGAMFLDPRLNAHCFLLLPYRPQALRSSGRKSIAPAAHNRMHRTHAQMPWCFDTLWFILCRTWTRCREGRRVPTLYLAGMARQIAGVLTAAACMVALCSGAVVGVPASKQGLYTGPVRAAWWGKIRFHAFELTLISPHSSTQTLSCDGGRQTIPIAKVNDDYCDCADGSDEPGTCT